MVPAGVCLRALASRLVTTWWIRCSSPTTSTEDSGSDSRQLVVGRQHAGIGDGLDEEAGQVDGLARQRAAGVEAGQQQQVLDQRGHPARLLLDLGQRGVGGGPVVGPAAGQLGVASDRGERRAQLVGGVGDELPDLLLAAVPRLE